MSYTCKAVSEVLKREFTKTLFKGELITGKITHKNETFMTVNIGYKTDARIYSETMWNYNKYQKHSEIQVYVEQIESEINETVISRRLLDVEEAWKVLIKTKLERSTVEGLIIDKISEGYIVKVLGLMALLPLSLVDERARSRALVGTRAQLSVYQLNKPDDFIKLKLMSTEKEIKEARQTLQIDEYAWGIVKEVLEDSIVVDFCSQKGKLTLQEVPWHLISELIEQIRLGQLIESRVIWSDGKDAQLSLKDKLIDGAQEQQVPIFGVIAQITRDWIIVQIEDKVLGFVSAERLGVFNLIEYMLDQNLEVGDTIKTLPIEIDYASRKVLADIDIDEARHFKYITQNRENTVMGALTQMIDSNTILVYLGDDIHGVIETDTPEQALEAFESLKEQTIELDIIDYDPNTGTIYLQPAADATAKALLVEA